MSTPPVQQGQEQDSGVDRMEPQMQTHRVALVVMCEADGYDAADAGAVAQMALSRLVHLHGEQTGQERVGSSSRPMCAACGVQSSVDDAGLVRAHLEAETWSPEEYAAEHPGEPTPVACKGSGQHPRTPQETIIGFDRPNGHGVYARVHRVMEAGAAIGNGYLWTHPTTKAYR